MKKRNLFLFFAAVCAAAAAVYLFKEQLKNLPFFHRFLGDQEDDLEEDILREYEETMAISSGEENLAEDDDAEADYSEDLKDKEERSSRNKIRRGYTEIHFHKEAEPEAVSE